MCLFENLVCLVRLISNQKELFVWHFSMSFFNSFGLIGFFSPFFVVYFLFFFGWVRAFYFRKQFLISLLSLELVVLSLFLGMLFIFGLFLKPVSFAFYLLVLGACEARLGLSLLVNIVRLGGNDMLSLFKVVKC